MGLFRDKISPQLVRMQAENALRYQYHLANLSRDQQRVLELLPMLFHINGALLFPSLEGDAVYGLFGYDPTDEDRAHLIDWFPTLKTLHPQKIGFFNRHQGVEFLYLMGSAGTLAFSAGSDMDFWIGIDRRRFKASELDLLKQKLTMLENWAMTSHQMEIHFFATDIDDLLHEDFGELGGESCGSVLKKLLKDEFYRSMIWLGGKYPMHWARPLGGGKVHANKSLIEIGSVDGFADQELVGAAQWQILKGFHSPFKSVIKIALLEAYAFSAPIVLLCNQLKQKILESAEVARVDPYLEMMETVRTFKRSQESFAKELRLLETCFLIKCLAGVSSTLHAKKWGGLFELATQWRFSRQEFMHLHEFNEWPYAEKAALSKAILEYFQSTYRRLNAKAEGMDRAISKRDSIIMSKTLRAYLMQEPVKVPRLFHLLEASKIHLIRFVQDRTVHGSARWTIQLDFHTTAQTGKQVPIFEHEDLLRTCAWLAVNGLYHSSQKFVVPMNEMQGVQFLSEFLRQFAAFLSTDSILAQVSRSGEKKVLLQRIFVIVNARAKESSQVLESLDCFALNDIGEVHQYGFIGSSAFEDLARNLLLTRFDLHSVSEDSVLFFDYGQMAQAKSKLTKELLRKFEMLRGKIQAHMEHVEQAQQEQMAKKSFWKLSAMWEDLS